MGKHPPEYFGCPAWDGPDCPVLTHQTDTGVEMSYLAIEEQADRFYPGLL